MCQVTQYKAPPAATGALDAGNELGRERRWIPAFAGMTNGWYLRGSAVLPLSPRGRGGRGVRGGGAGEGEGPRGKHVGGEWPGKWS